MALFEKIVQVDGTWRLRDLTTSEFVGRIWATTHIDRCLRDGDLAEAVAAILALPRTDRRAAAVEAYNNWLAAGGHSVDFATLAQNVPGDGNIHLLLGGADMGYLHGTVYNSARLLRFVRLAEELFAARQITNSSQRNQATDSALDRFQTDGALS